MQAYDNLIDERLDGETPKAKYDNLVKMQKLMYQIAYPRRGTDEEVWTAETIGKKAAETILFDKDY